MKQISIITAAFFLLIFTSVSCTSNKSAGELIQKSYGLRIQYSNDPNPQILEEVKLIVKKLKEENLSSQMQYELKEIEIFLFIAQCDLKGLRDYIVNSKNGNFAYDGQQQFYISLLNHVIFNNNDLYIDKKLLDKLQSDPENYIIAMDVVVLYSMTKTKQEVKEKVDSLLNLYSNPIFATWDTSDYKRYRVLDCE